MIISKEKKALRDEIIADAKTLCSLLAGLDHAGSDEVRQVFYPLMEKFKKLEGTTPEKLPLPTDEDETEC